MPIDKSAVLNGNSKQSQQQPIDQPTRTSDESTALTALSQTAAGTIRQSIGAMTQLAEKLEDQRSLVTDHAADRLSQILDPASIQAEIAARTLQKLEGKDFLPFELEPIELPEVRRYVPQLPASYAAQSLPSLPSSSTIDAVENETTSNGNLKTEAGKGFGSPRDNS